MAELKLPSLEEITDEFSELEDGAERIQYLIELGKTLPELPVSERVEENRVQGCQSNVWLIWQSTPINASQLYLNADSDAPMVRGLVAVLLAAYSGKTADEILAYPIDRLFDHLKLRTFLSPMRSNGLHAMVERVQSIARHIKSQNPIAGQSQRTTLTDIPATAAVQPRAACVSPLGDQELESIRADFPILETQNPDGQRIVYLDSAASSQRPRAVIETISRVYEQFYSNVHRGGHYLAAQTTELYEAAREKVRGFINAAHKQEVIFTSGTTASINLVARSWGDANLKPGDEILLTLMEHHSNIVPWHQAAARTGAKVRFIPLTDDYQLSLDAFYDMLSSRTKIVGVTGVSNVLGGINPIDEVTKGAHRVGALVMLDAAQSITSLKLDVQKVDVDFVAFSGHKMLGPSGIGVLYGKRALLDSMPAFLGGGSMIHTVSTEGFTPAALPSKFEAGTPPIVPAIGLGAAIDYINHIGLDRIHHHKQLLARHAQEMLATVPGIRFLGPSIEKRSGIVAFNIDGIHADDLSKVLDSQGVAIRAGNHCAMPLHASLSIQASARASFYIYNTVSDAEKLADAVRKAIKLLRS